MKKLIYTLCICLIISCCNRTKPQPKTVMESNEEIKDTTLVNEVKDTTVVFNFIDGISSEGASAKADYSMGKIIKCSIEIYGDGGKAELIYDFVGEYITVTQSGERYTTDLENVNTENTLTEKTISYNIDFEGVLLDTTVHNDARVDVFQQIKSVVPFQLRMYHYKQYDIKVIPLVDVVGEAIYINDKKRKRAYSIIEDIQFFIGVVDDYMIIDYGTSMSGRQMSVHNLDKNKTVFTSDYHYDIVIKGKKILLDVPVEIAQRKKPKCPPSEQYPKYNGYIEKQVFDLSTLKLTKTGQIECAYFE